MGRMQRDKGARNERDLQRKLKAAGLDALRVPLSGACDGFKDDVIIYIPNGELCPPDEIAIEAKVRANGFKQIYKWLPDEGVLAIRSDHNEWLVVERLSDWVKRL